MAERAWSHRCLEAFFIRRSQRRDGGTRRANPLRLALTSLTLVALAGCTVFAASSDERGEHDERDESAESNDVAAASAPSTPSSTPSSGPSSGTASTLQRSTPPSLAPTHAARRRLDGRSFPDKVIALTWDDGPDANTLELAEYLKSRKISATFFVVRSWVDGLSDDPGSGKGVFESGYEFFPVLGDLVALGHRLGNHTLNHVVLRAAVGDATIDRELRENQRALDRFESNELRLFRVPGGGWGSAAAGVVDKDPYLSSLVGPVFWDIDRKDWDESLACEGAHRAAECERGAPGGARRMKPSVLAQRYVAAIDAVGRGIVLLHDRVGHVGSTYAVDVAEAMIPQLEARGYVFAAPVLHFSPLELRLHEGPHDFNDPSRWDGETIRLGDVNGDGRGDLCGRTPAGIDCAVSVAASTSSMAMATGNRLVHTVFRSARTRANRTSPPKGTLHLADITGDGQCDVCVRGENDTVCAAADALGALGPFRRWQTDPGVRELRAGEMRSVRFADIDGDEKADVCGRTARGIVCAKSTGKTFDRPTTWLDASDAREWRDDRGGEAGGTLQLADVDGDGRADVCGRGTNGILCALSEGHSFGRVHGWSIGTTTSGRTNGGNDDKSVREGARGSAVVRFGDLNGDGRADVCELTNEGLACALSNGHAFTRARVWLDADEIGANGWNTPESSATIQLGDVNGDGRADVCGRGRDGIVCGLAP